VRVLGYVRVSTGEQAANGAGLDAQRNAILDEAAKRNWTILDVHEDAGVSGRTLDGRPGLSAVLRRIETGEADALVVAKLDRLSRSLMDFAQLMERSRRQRWALVALDLGVDTSTPSGEMMASVLAVFAQFERRLIGQRTKEALAVRRSQGVRLGRPPAVAPEIRERIAAARSDGQTFRTIADELNAEGVPTAHQGRAWHGETVRRIAGAGTN
jgi:DNA invertase Pin-like site-specific DNA recombinase